MTIPLEVYLLLEKEVGKETAEKVSKVLETSFDAIEKKAEEISLQKKFEIREELRKELASKEDLLLVKNELKNEIELLRAEIELKLTKLDRKFTIMLIIIVFTIIFLNQQSLEFIFKILGLIK